MRRLHSLTPPESYRLREIAGVTARFTRRWLIGQGTHDRERSSRLEAAARQLGLTRRVLGDHVPLPGDWPADGAPNGA